ncbi:hypothetical protein [Aquimarina algiphila]|uniref:hypothetical protein n=1 Tax=Aquimarina algiphila TaxID=2047982 RepID=UPI00248FB905|nr:hypothetical protein [Aquimarina algiphila]
MNWRNLSFIGENKIIKSSYIYLFLVPVLAKFLSKIKSPLIVNLGGQDIELIFELPFSYKMFFLSAILFSLGNLLYGFVAPKIIKENKSYGDFKQQGKNIFHVWNYLEDLGINESWKRKIKHSQSEYKIKGMIHYKSNYKKSKIGFVNKVIDEKLKLLDSISYNMNSSANPEYRTENEKLSFWNVYNFSNNSRKFLQTLTTLFFVGGFIAIFLVVYQGAIIVLSL